MRGIAIFLGGLFCGVPIGIFTFALLTAAKRGDENVVPFPRDRVRNG